MWGLVLSLSVWPAVLCASVQVGTDHVASETSNVIIEPDHVVSGDSHVSAPETPANSNECMCVPDQWKGLLISTDREYDMNGGHSNTAENRMSVHYDYRNKRFAMTDLNTGSRAIADYKRGLKYVTRGDFCHGMETSEEMKQMCLPEKADYLGQYTLGTTVPVDLWEFHGPFNTSMKTAVLRDDCVPVSEEISMRRGGYVSVTSSVYLNVKIGSLDDEVFTPPSGCVVQRFGPQGMPGAYQKRSNPKHFDDLLNALRQRLYIFN